MLSKGLARKMCACVSLVLKRRLHIESTNIGILGVPFDKGQGKTGVANGPGAIRAAGLVEQLASIHEKMDVKDFGDVTYCIEPNIEDLKDIIPNMKAYAHVARCSEHVSKKVREVISENRTCITIGGDHSIAIGSVDGHLKAEDNNVCLLWIDAHADLNTNKTSASGNIHGMPLALLIKELKDYWPYLPGMDWQMPILSIRNVAYIGLRSVDSYERLLIERLGVTAFGMEHVEEFGISMVIKMALDKIDPEGKRSIHISFDIDALDPSEAPSTGTPVRGGITLREGIHLMELIHKTGRLGALDMVEINPEIGDMKDVKRTLDAASYIIQSACGHYRRGLKPYVVQKLLQTPTPAKTPPAPATPPPTPATPPPTPATPPPKQ